MYSTKASVHCNIVSGYLTVYPRYFQCTVIYYSQNIYRLGEQIQTGQCTPQNQCTLQYCIRLFNSVQRYAVPSVMDLNNRYRMDIVLCIEQCTLQYNIVSRFLTSYSIYFQCALILYSQTMYRFGEHI